MHDKIILAHLTHFSPVFYFFTYYAPENLRKPKVQKWNIGPKQVKVKVAIM